MNLIFDDKKIVRYFCGLFHFKILKTPQMQITRTYVPLFIIPNSAAPTDMTPAQRAVHLAQNLTFPHFHQVIIALVISLVFNQSFLFSFKSSNLFIGYLFTRVFSDFNHPFNNNLTEMRVNCQTVIMTDYNVINHNSKCFYST